MAKKARKRRAKAKTQDQGTNLIRDLPCVVVRSSEWGKGKRRADGAEVSLEETAQAGKLRIRVRGTCKIETYHLRFQLIDRQFEAGMKFASLWRRGSLPQSVTANYGDAMGGGGGADISIDAREHIRDAMIGAGMAHEVDEAFPVKDTSAQIIRFPVRGAVRLTKMGNIVIAVCGFDEWAGGTERLQLLREGLTRLADHWRIWDEGRPVAAKR